MTDGSHARSAQHDDQRSAALAIACVGGWVAAAAAARVLGLWLAVGGAAVVLGAAVWVRDRDQARRLLRPSLGLIVAGAAAGGAMATITVLVYPVLARDAPFIAREAALLYAAFRAPSLAVASIALAPVVVGEELVWRGVVQTAFTRRFGLPVGVVLTAAAYALAHVTFRSPVLVVVALLCGIAWGALRAASKSLVPALVAHLVWDAVVLLCLPLA